MIDLFYAIIALFAIDEVYHSFNRKRLDLLFEKKEPENMRRLDVFHYLLQVLSVLWSVIGLFSSMWPLFAGLISAGILKFAIYHLSERTYIAYSRFAYPAILIALYSAILAMKFIR